MLGHIILVMYSDYLGVYDGIEDAAKTAEKQKKYFLMERLPIIRSGSEKAELEPAWAKSNPVQIPVSKKNTNELTVTLLPQI